MQQEHSRQNRDFLSYRVGFLCLFVFLAAISSILLISGCATGTSQNGRRPTRGVPFLKNVPIFGYLFTLPQDWFVDMDNELVMTPGMKITATTPVGTMTITAHEGLRRSYTWEGETRSVKMLPRETRWEGSLGIYYPGPGNHWKEHHGIRRAVVEEGQQHFDSTDEALAWMRLQEEGLTYVGKKSDERYVYPMPFVYTDDGLAVGWGKVLPRSQLNVEVWQIYIQGEKPSKLPDSPNDKIVIEYLD